jgi:hypothetical protein
MCSGEAVCRGFMDDRWSLIPSCMVVSNEASGIVRGPEDSTIMVERLMQFVIKLLAVVMASSGYALEVWEILVNRVFVSCDVYNMGVLLTLFYR